MLKGIYSAVSAMIAGVNKHAAKSHNISNLDTPGFKQVLSDVQEFQHTEVTQSGVTNQRALQQPIGNLGLGSMTTEGRTDFTNGALLATNQTFDFAI